MLECLGYGGLVVGICWVGFRLSYFVSFAFWVEDDLIFSVTVGFIFIESGGGGSGLRVMVEVCQTRVNIYEGGLLAALVVKLLLWSLCLMSYIYRGSRGIIGIK